MSSDRDHFIRIYGALTVDSNKKVGAYAYKDFFVYPENIENLLIEGNDLLFAGGRDRWLGLLDLEVWGLD